MQVSSPVAIVLAAGEGRRMQSDLPKVLHTARGRCLVDWVLDAARAAGVTRTGDAGIQQQQCREAGKYRFHGELRFNHTLRCKRM